MQGNFKVIKSDFKKYLQNCNEQFDIIFLDPPYANNFYLPALEIIFAKNLLAPDGIIVCEHNKQDIIEQDFFEQINTKTYGIKSLTYLKHKNN
jgi:16S rRNA (guanine966-N2)-methyltransferase